MKKKVLYFDCFAGISGDMTVGALLDLGCDFEVLKRKLEELPVDGYRISVEKKIKSGISSLKFNVHLDSEEHPDHIHKEKDHKHTHEHHEHSHEHSHGHTHKHAHEHTHQHSHVHRNLDDVSRIIDNSSFSDAVKKMAKQMFLYVAKAEAKVHDKPLNEIHFHEVGAIDSIIDILSAAYCIDAIGADDIYAGPVAIGEGFVKCAHGMMPLPAPATAEILRDIPLRSTGIPKELTTPTGAAIIKSVASRFAPLEGGTIIKTGYGAGSRDLDIPNVLRVFLVQEEELLVCSDNDDEQIVELATNIDDMNPELCIYLVDRLFQTGALDVYYTSIIMKKGRPGIRLSVLCNLTDARALEEVIFSETTSFGIRRYEVSRSILERDIVQTETRYGVIPVKRGFLGKKLVSSSPEFEVCKRVAIEHNVPLKEVYEAAKRGVK